MKASLKPDLCCKADFEWILHSNCEAIEQLLSLSS